MVQRNAWVAWFPDPFFLNIYVLLIAPPRLNAKTTIIKYGANILRAFPLYLSEPEKIKRHYVSIIQDKTTPEKLIERLTPGNVQLKMGSKVVPVSVMSHAAIIISELGTMLGKQRYQEGMVSNLMALYDCPDRFEISTITRGTQMLRDVFVTILAGTTPRALSSTIPESATEEGLLSRTIPVYQKKPTRSYEIPQKVKGAPTEGDLAQRLCWIAQHRLGEYKLTSDAMDIYRDWYHDFRSVYAKTWEDRLAQARMDNYVLKVATLLRMNQYEQGSNVRAGEVEDAIKILNATYAHAADALVDIGTTGFQQHMRSAEKKIRDENVVTRRDLLTSIRWLNSAECTQAVNQLYQEGKLKIRLGGSYQKYATANGKEQYLWLKTEKTD